MWEAVMGGTKLRIWIVRVLAIFGVTLLIFFGWSRFHPRFALPDDVKNTPFEEPLRQKMTALTANHGWFQTDASLRNLSKHSAVGDRLELIRAEFFPSVEFYHIRLSVYHALHVRSLSAPYGKFTVAVDGQSGRVWRFERGGVHSEMIPFLRALDVTIDDEKDVARLWDLYLCLHPASFTEAEIHHPKEDRWCVIPERKSILGFCVELDSERYVKSIDLLTPQR